MRSEYRVSEIRSAHRSEIGLRRGEHVEVTAQSIGELRWQVREEFRHLLQHHLEQRYDLKTDTGYRSHFFRQPAQSGGESALPANQYDPADAVVRQTNTVPEQVHTVTTVTTDQTVEVPAPAQTVVLEDPSRSRKLDYGLAIW